MKRLIFILILISGQTLWANPGGVAEINLVLTQLESASNVYLNSHDSNIHRLQSYERVFILGQEVTRLFNENVQTISKKNKADLFRRIRKAKKFTKVPFYGQFNSGKFVYTEKNAIKHYTNMVEHKKKITIRERLKNAKLVRRFAMDFVKQFPAFSIAGVIIGAGDSISKDNPVAYQQAIDAMLDPLGMASFGGFILGNQLATAILSRTKYFPQGLTHYAGMAVGMFLSSVMHELLVDITGGDIYACRNRKDKTQPHDACDRAAERWLTKDKYVGYTPDILSLGAAAYGSSKINKFIANTKNVSIQIIERKNEKLVKAALSVISKIPGGGFALTVGNFVIFMKFHHKIMPLFTVPWNYFNFNYWGWSLSEELKADKGKSSSYVRTKNKSDEERKWFDSNINNFSRYFRLDNYYNCFRKPMVESLSNIVHKNIDVENASGAYLDELINRHLPKYAVILSEHCARQVRPGLIMENDYAFNRAKNKLKLAKFEAKQNNWYELLGDFSQVYSLAEKFYKEILHIKFNPTKSGVHGDTDKRSMEYLRGFLDNIMTEGDNPKMYPRGLDGMQFGHIADYFLYSMACGPMMSKLTNTHGKREWGADNQAGVKMMKTPFGSSFEFVPPRITSMYENGSMEQYENEDQEVTICNDKIITIFNSKFGKELEDEWNSTDGVYRNSFMTKVNQAKYKSLVHYLFENIDPNFKYTAEDENDFSWDSHVLPYVENIWEEYDIAYQKIVKNDLIPKLTFIEKQNQNQRESLKDGGTITVNHDILPERINKQLIISETYKRFEKISQNIIATAKVANVPFSKLEVQLNNLLQFTEIQMNIHRDRLKKWDNRTELYITAEQEVETLKYLGKILNSLPSYIFLNKKRYHSISALYESLNPDCNDTTMKEIHSLLRASTHKIDTITCQSNKGKSLKILEEIQQEHQFIDLMATQINILHNEIIDYFTLITDLTRTIGYKKQEQE